MKQKQGSTLATCTYDELIRFKRDHVDWMGWSLIVDLPDVVICGNGNDGPTFSMPRHIFNRLVKGYIKARLFVRKPARDSKTSV